MNNLLLVVMLMFRATAFAGGEIGNEVLTKNGKPLSTEVAPCSTRYHSWKNFVDTKEQQHIPDMSSFLNMVGEVFYPLKSQLLKTAHETHFCETDYDINKRLPNLPVADRVSLFISRGDGKKNLVLIDNRKMYSKKVTSAERAATVVRELMHDIYLPYTDDSDKEWRIHNLIYELHNAYVSKNPAQYYGKIRDLILNYSFYDESSLPIACQQSTEICKNTLSIFLEREGIALKPANVIKNGIRLEWKNGVLNKQDLQVTTLYSKQNYKLLFQITNYSDLELAGYVLALIWKANTTDALNEAREELINIGVYNDKARAFFADTLSSKINSLVWNNKPKEAQLHFSFLLESGEVYKSTYSHNYPSHYAINFANYSSYENLYSVFDLLDKNGLNENFIKEDSVLLKGFLNIAIHSPDYNSLAEPFKRFVNRFPNLFTAFQDEIRTRSRLNAQAWCYLIQSEATIYKHSDIVKQLKRGGRETRKCIRKLARRP